MSSLSVGAAVREMLLSSEVIRKTATKVYPVVVDEAKLPYLVYRRTGADNSPTKCNQGADVVTVEVDVYAATYSEGVVLAESARSALEYRQGQYGSLRVRGVVLMDASEDWSDDAFVQTLVFQVRC